MLTKMARRSASDPTEKSKYQDLHSHPLTQPPEWREGFSRNRQKCFSCQENTWTNLSVNENYLKWPEPFFFSKTDLTSLSSLCGLTRPASSYLEPTHKHGHKIVKMPTEVADCCWVKQSARWNTDTFSGESAPPCDDTSCQHFLFLLLLHLFVEWRDLLSSDRTLKRPTSSLASLS